MHCVAHRLALAVSQAAKVVGPVERFKNYINSLYVYFHRSPDRRGKRHATFKSLFNKPSLNLRKPAETRWLACDEAIQVIKKSLYPLAITLQDIVLTDYCREEFAKFITFLTSKIAEIGQFSGEIGRFSE